MKAGFKFIFTGAMREMDSSVISNHVSEEIDSFPTRSYARAISF